MAFGVPEGIRTPDLLVRSAYETVLIGKISCKTVPFGLVSAFRDARNWKNPIAKKAFGRLMDGKNRRLLLHFKRSVANILEDRNQRDT